MDLQLILCHALTIQSLITVVFGGVCLATKYFLNPQKYLMIFIDIPLRSNTMSVSSLSPSALQIPRPTSGSRLQYLVCLSLVSYGPSILSPSSGSDAPSRVSGRYPWAVEDALRKYGDVLRIAPNELVFFTPQAFLGEY